MVISQIIPLWSVRLQAEGVGEFLIQNMTGLQGLTVRFLRQERIGRENVIADFNFELPAHAHLRKMRYAVLMSMLILFKNLWIKMRCQKGFIQME